MTHPGQRDSENTVEILTGLTVRVDFTGCEIGGQEDARRGIVYDAGPGDPVILSPAFAREIGLALMDAADRAEAIP